MNEIRKYDKIRTTREQLRDLSLNLGDLVSVLNNELIDDKAKEIIEEQAWNIVEKINEITKINHGKKE